MKKYILILTMLLLFFTGCFEEESTDDGNGIVWKVKNILTEEVIDASVKIDSPYITDSSTDNMVEISKSGYISKIGVVPLKYGQKNLIGYLLPDFSNKFLYKISGTVKDGDTNGVINGAYISVCGNFISKKGKSDINGVFEIDSIPAGNIEITVYKDGYNSNTTKMNLSADTQNLDKIISEDSTKSYGDIIGSISGYQNDICSNSYITVGMSGSDVYKTTFSDINGNYALYGVPYNTYIISCKTPGFYSVNNGSVTVSSATNTKDISMSIISGD